MSQATLERPAPVTGGTTKPAKRSATPREKILLQLSKLQGLIALMVETEQGDCVGRVLEHAGKMMPAAIELFTAGDEKNVADSYEELLEADSFIKAAGALVAQDFNVSDRGYKGRTSAADTIVILSEKVVTAIDSYIVDIRRSPPAGAQAAPEAHQPEGATQPSAGGRDAAERRQLVLEATWQIDTLVTLLLECGRREKTGDSHLYLPAAVKALGTRIEQLNIAVLDAIDEKSGANIADIAQQINGTSEELVNATPA